MESKRAFFFFALAFEGKISLLAALGVIVVCLYLWGNMIRDYNSSICSCAFGGVVGVCVFLGVL